MQLKTEDRLLIAEVVIVTDQARRLHTVHP